MTILDSSEDPVPSDDGTAANVPPAEPTPTIHPYAAVYPRMADDELLELSEDIRLHGQREPIILNTSGQILDGRNRYDACRLAGVEPLYETKDIEDPRAYIQSKNSYRRHLSKSQKAMAHAMLYPESENPRGGRGRKNPEATSEFSDRLLQQARFVFRHAPDLAEKVKAGSSLEDAYTAARELVETREAYERVRLEAREHFECIANICTTQMTNINNSDTRFLDQSDFLKQAKSDADQIIEYAQKLRDIV